MIIKRYNESRKEAEVLRQYNVLHVDGSQFSRYAIGSLLMEYDFIVKRFASVRTLEDASVALKSGEYDLLLVNSAFPGFDLAALKKARKGLPGLVVVVYNFSGAPFEKMQMLKAGINGLFDPETPFEELLFALQELRPGSVLQNNLVSSTDLKKAANIAGSSKDYTRQETEWIRAFCKEADSLLVARQCGLTPAASARMHQHLAAKSGCENRGEFIRLAMMFKWIRSGEKLLAELQAAS